MQYGKLPLCQWFYDCPSTVIRSAIYFASKKGLTRPHYAENCLSLSEGGAAHGCSYGQRRAKHFACGALYHTGECRIEGLVRFRVPIYIGRIKRDA